jgi:hypothetical protein
VTKWLVGLVALLLLVAGVVVSAVVLGWGGALIKVYPFVKTPKSIDLRETVLLSDSAP